MKSAALLLVFLLTAAAAAAQTASTEPAGGNPGWLLRGAERAFTSDRLAFGQVHLPVIASNPNSGMTYGVLPVWLVHDSSSEITQIFAPMFTYNRVYGAAFSGSYVYTPSSQEKLRAVLEKAERSNYRMAVIYDSLQLFGGRSTVHVETNYEADGGVQYYGVGPATTQGDQASERLREDLAKADLGIRFGGGEEYVATAGMAFRRTQVQSGPFPAPTPLDPKVQTTTSYSEPRVSAARDTRDLPFTPSRGSLTEAFAQFSVSALGSSSSFERYGGQWRLYLPTSADLVTALHAETEWSGGGYVPYTALASLGGARSLRAFPEGRFQDRGMSYANIEERWRVYSVDMIHAKTEFQIAPFLDAGTVYAAPRQAQARCVDAAAGVAFRVIVRPSVVGKVEVGVGREGPAVFVGIDYPF